VGFYFIFLNAKQGRPFLGDWFLFHFLMGLGDRHAFHSARNAMIDAAQHILHQL
jgi:hypothetical protein